ncbi:MetQ/NlpA family ABC transporter substrate-binding protein [Actinomyces bowdenii]|uniref:MetQ/NlpA family ABC transporter substrate-binding protein n=1 Tax=Actinomyces bowdenii TaxID=131109 RepID=UPI00214D0A94|nr:MetQ/NlpA family ABC transporter substrate-binding protein [Actinomyces bowdenii]MCR2053247.1 MetQ/NlpA family ABC transporter substrate-binding protein [Actinomyces bowdenii]
MSATITRRTFSVGLVAAVGATLAACSSDSGSGVSGITKEGETSVISVGASPQPHVTILQFVQDNLVEGSGISLDIVEINDYQTPNTSLDDGSLAANFFQTPNYLAQQIKDKGFDFVAISDVHIEPLGLYSSKASSVEEIPSGGEIILNSDPANTARGLKLLAQAGLIELDAAVEQPADTDITSNPKNLTFTTVDGAQVARSMQDADAAVINGNYAIEAGLVPSKDALELEKAENSPYVNQLVVRTEDKDNADLKKLAELLNRDEVRSFIQETWTDGSVLPAF